MNMLCVLCKFWAETIDRNACVHCQERIQKQARKNYQRQVQQPKTELAEYRLFRNSFNLISLNLGPAAGPVQANKTALQLRIVETLESNLRADGHGLILQLVQFSETSTIFIPAGVFTTTSVIHRSTLLLYDLEQI